jgi:NitT/TauT family transport system ATP-binding protein
LIVTTVPSPALRLRIEGYGASEAEAKLKGLSLSVNPGQVECLLGVSGVGKSTILRILFGEPPLPFFAGAVHYWLNGTALTPQEAQRRALVGFIGQDKTLVPWLSVAANLALPSKLNRLLAPPSSEEIAETLESLAFDLKYLSCFPHVLSHGMGQRVALARLLLFKPQFAFLDELFSGLDAATTELATEKLLVEVRTRNVVCLLVTHDLRHALATSAVVHYLRSDGTIYHYPENIDEPTIQRWMREDIRAMAVVSRGAPATQAVRS